MQIEKRIKHRSTTDQQQNLFDNKLSYKYQSGFLPHHSTVFQLFDICHSICQAFDDNMFSCILFCDVSKAFGRVWHKGLLFKHRSTTDQQHTLIDNNLWYKYQSGFLPHDSTVFQLIDVRHNLCQAFDNNIFFL